MKLFPETPPPGPFRPGSWRSPLRGTRLTAILGFALLAAIPLVALTGFLSYVAYSPKLGDNGAAFGGGSFLEPLAFPWPTSPSWLYVLTQGLHVVVGIAAVPVLLAKLWSVIPKLFEWPPVRSPAHALERLSLALLVGGALFEFGTGILNVQVFYPWGFSFLEAHLYGAWIFTAAFALHVALKLPLARSALRTREEVMTAAAAPTAEPTVSAAGAQPVAGTLSRRGLLAVVGGSSLGLLVLTGGQVVGGPLRKLALLAPHGEDKGSGANAFQVNKTARAVGIGPREVEGWELELAGGRSVRLSRAELLALPQHTETLPIACVEGWSTTQEWTGVRLSDLAEMTGAAGRGVSVSSLQRGGLFNRASLAENVVSDPRSLLALKVNQEDLSLDHGFPARVIAPAVPGVHCTKWVTRLEFGGEAS